MIKVTQEIDLHSFYDMERVLNEQAFRNWGDLSEDDIRILENYILNERYDEGEVVLSIADLNDILIYDIDYILESDPDEDYIEDPEDIEEEE